MFKWLFGAKAAPPQKSKTSAIGRRIDLRAFNGKAFNVVHVAELGFTGLYSQSPNQRFILIWRDGNDEGTHGGARQSGLGRFYLIDNGHIVCEGRVERPNDGKVANNGTFIINDWHFNTGELSGTFLAFRGDGSQIITRRFEANLYNNGLAEDGCLAVCQTANAPNSPDSSRLTIFDLETGVETGGCVPESGWATGYEFSEQGVRLVYKDLGAFNYGTDGSFTDRQHWITASLERGSIYVIQNLVHEVGEAPESGLLERLLAATHVAATNPDYGDIRSQALVMKLRGICLDSLSRPSDALVAFEKALALDPKIGVKRRAEQLRKQLTSK
jgi:hypothetical protein